MNDDLHKKSGFLHEEALEALCNELAMIVGGAANTDQRHRALGPMVFGDPLWLERQLLSVGSSLIVWENVGHC